MAKTSLAVKYRPKTFDDLTEQGAIKDILNNQISTKTFQHAYLFTGPAGTGKTTSARIFANEINNGQGNPIEVDGASNSGVDNIRRIIDDSKKKALDAEYKIFIVDECHALSSGAWQAMLKLLEEPPKTSIFILCTTDPQKIPATIMSRVQRYQFNKISDNGVISRLKHILEQECINTYEEPAIAYIAKLANGGMRDAITMMDKCLSLSSDLTVDNVLQAVGSEDYDTFCELLSDIRNHDNNCVLIIDNIYNSGKDLKQFMKQFERFILDVCKFSVFGDIRYTSLPETAKMTQFLADNDISIRILDLVHTINLTLRYDSDARTTIQTIMMIYVGDENDRAEE